ATPAGWPRARGGSPCAGGRGLGPPAGCRTAAPRRRSGWPRPARRPCSSAGSPARRRLAAYRFPVDVGALAEGVDAKYARGIGSPGAGAPARRALECLLRRIELGVRPDGVGHDRFAMRVIIPELEVVTPEVEPCGA